MSHPLLRARVASSVPASPPSATPLPRDLKLRSERLLPRCRKSNTDTADPKRAKLRKDIALPKCKKSRTESPLPMRPKLRNDNELPKWRKSSTDKTVQTNVINTNNDKILFEKLGDITNMCQDKIHNYYARYCIKFIDVEIIDA